jgi:hypothetical protein
MRQDQASYNQTMTEPRFEDFVRDYRERRGVTKLPAGTPVLVRVGQGGSEDSPARLGFRTQSRHGEVHEAGGGPGSLAELGVVSFILKKPSGAFPEQISVGRATNTDVYLPLPGISKYHAFFSVATKGIVMLTDVGSKNGTFVNDQKLTPKKAVRLWDCDLISLGSNDFVFHSYSSFMQLLQRAAAG